MRAVAALAVLALASACAGGDGDGDALGSEELGSEELGAAGDSGIGVDTSVAGAMNETENGDPTTGESDPPAETDGQEPPQEPEVEEVPMDPIATGEEAPTYSLDGGDECFALCESAASDDDGDDWGWENEASCIVAGSGTAQQAEPCAGSEPPAAVDEPDEPAEMMPIDVTVPGDVDRPEDVLSTGFFVFEGRLYDRNGNDFVIRGVNNAHVWFDTFDRNEAYNALPAIAGYGFNSVRIVWETATDGADAALLRRIVARVVELEMVPMIELHDVTGEGSNAGLMRMAEYYTSSDIKSILTDYEDYLLINIANEWSGMDWVGGYSAAIAHLRDNGVNHTLVIDANEWGQNVDIILESGAQLMAADPQSNLLFSTHMYQNFSERAGGRNKITSSLETAVSLKLPLIIGEFGFQHGDPPEQVDWQHILAECARLGLGYMPWSWKGNSSDVAYLDMSEDWGGNQLTDWGSNVINDTNGIANTSQKASVFLL